jgi:hypothetical protein
LLWSRNPGETKRIDALSGGTALARLLARANQQASFRGNREMVSPVLSSASIAATYQSSALTSAASQNSSAQTLGPTGIDPRDVDPQDLVTISTQGQLASRFKYDLPTPQSLQSVEARLNQKLNTLFSNAGISASPPISFSVDPNNDQVTVTSNRPDAKQIENLINKDPALRYEVGFASAQASQLSLSQKAIQAEDAYLAAKTPAQLQAVISQYYSSPVQADNITFSFDG